MMTKFLYRNILLILALPLFFLSCNDEEEDKVFELEVDAYIVKRQIDDVTKYANAYFAYGNKAIESATVTPPAGVGGSVELAASESSISVFFREPAMEDFTTMSPTQGNYVFDVESREGEVLQQSDMLEGEQLEIPEITEVTYQSNIETMTVKWDPEVVADGFVVKLLDQNKKVVFVSYTLIASAEEYDINQISGNWDGTAYLGEDYTIQVQAFTVESTATEDNGLYNINEVAIAEKAVTWGPQD